MLAYEIAFMEVAKSLSFSGAGVILDKTEECISKQVRVLEKKLGIKLFDRSRNHVKITKEGAKVFKLYCEIEKIYEKIEGLRNDD
jgi:DNA-binding transcriptional LysR family regulator